MSANPDSLRNKTGNPLMEPETTCSSIQGRVLCGETAGGISCESFIWTRHLLARWWPEPSIRLKAFLLLSEGTKLTEPIRSRLLQNGIREVYIEDELSQGIHTIANGSGRGADTDQNAGAGDHVHSLAQVRSERTSRFRNGGNACWSRFLLPRDILHHLSDIRTIDDYTFSPIASMWRSILW